MEHIEQASLAAPELAERYAVLGDLYNRKLWHQLTLALDEFTRDPANVRGDNLIRLFREFVAKFELKLNQLKLAQIASACAKTFGSPEEAAAMYEALLEKRGRLGAEASLYLEMELAGIRLKQARLDDVKKVLATGKEAVDALSGTSETVVYSSFYHVAAEYHKLVGPPESFYKHALNYLAYTPAEALPLETRRGLAVDMALAALTGEGVYNFGEVLATPILQSLADTPNAWLAELLQIFERGDIAGFGALLEANREAYYAQPALSAREKFVKEKLVLLALGVMCFETPAHERTISFDAIHARCGLASSDEVEWVCMRAMALGLIRGTIDEVERNVDVTWVAPRVLLPDQLGQLSDQLGAWSSRAHTALAFMQQETPELVA